MTCWTEYEPATDPVLSDAEELERKIDAMIREADELMALAANPKTADQLEPHKTAIGQLMSRVQLVASFLLDRKPPQFIRRVS